jgi:opacity protein-like surface antigen
MKIKLLVAAAATVLASSAMAKSAFEGFYMQLGTGYESNSVANLNATGIEYKDSHDNNPHSWSTGNQNFGAMPLVVGLGYNFSVAPKWLLGIGVDSSAISQQSSDFNYTSNDIVDYTVATFFGSSVQTSNAVNIFVTPGYVIDKDKLVYVKAGYSAVDLPQNFPNSISLSDAVLLFPSRSNTLSGYMVGLGYKQIIRGGFYGFGEANYMSYGHATYHSITVTPDNTLYTFTNHPSLKSYQLLVGVGYKF